MKLKKEGDCHMRLKRVVSIVVLGLITLAVPGDAEAQVCSELCVENVDQEGNFLGFGCSSGGGYLDNCQATADSCSLDACEIGSITTDDGTVLVVAPTCKWREALEEGSRLVDEAVMATERSTG